MLEVLNHTDGDYKQGGELPSVFPKLVLETTEHLDALVAIGGYNRDPRGHRPHYVIDPVGYNIYKVSNSLFSAIGTFHPTMPQRVSRCIFVAICKAEVLTLTDEESVNTGRLLRALCDIEGVPAIAWRSQPGEKIGIDTLNRFEGIIGWSAFPSFPEIQTPGFLNWAKINDGLQNYDTPERLGISGSGEVEVFEVEAEVAVETATEDLNDLKVAELKEIASELNIASFSSMKKSELIDAITAARS
jgi:hypothetical protein